jgi:AcrR family transcriptional regulator
MGELASLGVRRGPAHVEARREALFDSLIPLFLDEGFFDLSMGDMARHARCSKSSLYLIGDTKDQIVVSVVRAFFRRATEWITADLDPEKSIDSRIATYLRRIAEALSPASQRFFVDVDAFTPARQIYQQNTRIAAEYVQSLATEAVGQRSLVDAVFVGSVAGIVMSAIHRKEVEELTGLDDASAYRALASLIVAGVTAPGESRPRPIEGDVR